MKFIEEKKIFEKGQYVCGISFFIRKGLYSFFKDISDEANYIRNIFK